MLTTFRGGQAIVCKTLVAHACVRWNRNATRRGRNVGVDFQSTPAIDIRSRQTLAATAKFILLFEVEHVEQVADRRHLHGYVWIDGVEYGIWQIVAATKRQRL